MNMELSTVLCIRFTDRISRLSQMAEGGRFGAFRMHFVDFVHQTVTSNLHCGSGDTTLFSPPYRSFYIPTITYVQEQWVATKINCKYKQPK